MKRYSSQFPIVSDDEPVITVSREMSLYETSDLIMNIRKGYHPKPQDDDKVAFNMAITKASFSPKSESSYSTALGDPQYVRRSRDRAKRDIKEKRQHFIVNSSPSSSIRLSAQEKNSTYSQVLPSDEKLTGLARGAEKLRQESYILAELPRLYRQPDNSFSETKPKKNTYDFLKRSQVYNYPENQVKKERQIATELNLTRFE